MCMRIEAVYKRINKSPVRKSKCLYFFGHDPATISTASEYQH